MKEPVLVILAAGMGSRYGGLKQIDTVGSNNESIIDFSIYDAYQAGFRKVILIIRREHEALFDEHIANKIRPFMDVVYAYQDINDLPEGYRCPAARTKPWGTTQALLATKKIIDSPFMVINADDFYGRESYQIMYDFLTRQVSDDTFGMVGYQLTKTLTDNGTVTRGVCQVDDGYLTSIVETTNISRVNGHAYADGIEIADGIASMNYWGMTPAVFPLLEQLFADFLKQHGEELKSEHVIPTAIGSLIASHLVRVKVMKTAAEWFGVTYAQDKESVANKIQNFKNDGVYPFDLWKR